MKKIAPCRIKARCATAPSFPWVLHVWRALSTPTVVYLLVFQVGLPIATHAQTALTPIIERQGEYFQVGLGHGVTGLGDINGDGWPDVGVQTGDWLCQFRIYYGGPGILDNVPDLVLPGGGNALMADMNGDGYPDLCLVICNFANRTDIDTLCVYLGRPGPGMRIDTVPSMRFATPWGAGEFGSNMASGDLNGDGYADLALSSGLHFSGSPPLDGAVFVFMGRPVLDSVPDFVGMDSTLHHTQYGTRCRIADINGDGFDDLIVTGRYWDSDTTPVQEFSFLYVYRGKPGWTYKTRAPDQYLDPSSFGFSKYINIAMQYSDALDMNNDGRADLLVHIDTAWTVPTSYINIYYSTNTGFSTKRGRVLRPFRYAFFDHNIRRVGDLDGNGYRDFAITEGQGDLESKLFYYHGTATGFEAHDPLYPFASSSCWNNDGYYGDGPPPRVDDAGDFNGDGVDDVVAGSPREHSSQFGYFHVVSGIPKPVRVEAPQAPPAAVTLGPAWPNPAHASCTFEVRLAESADVRVTMHDLLGRAVRTLAACRFPAGARTLGWDGRDEQGTPVAPGMYWYSVETAQTRTTGKVVLR